MKKLHLSAAIFSCLALGIVLPAQAKQIRTVPTDQYEPIKAEIIDSTPENFTINVKFMANYWADKGADVFSVYTSNSEPETCADFTDIELSYQKPAEHKRQFDLSDHPEILEAVREYNCVAIPNIPKG